MTEAGRTTVSQGDRGGSPRPSWGPEMSRRQVLTGMGGGIAAAAVLGPVSALLGPGRSGADPSKGRRVAVFGGGPGGMEAAHQLVKRGFTVTLYDENDHLGGMVRAWMNPRGSGVDAPFEMSAQHFVLPSYAILPGVLKDIPDGHGGTVFDHTALIPQNPSVRAASQGRYAPATVGYTQLMVPTPVTPTTLRGIPPERYPEVMLTALQQIGKYTPADAALLASKFASWIVAGPRRCKGQLDKMTLRRYFRTDRMSENAAELVWLIEHVLGSDAEGQGGSADALKTFYADPVLRMLDGREGYYWGLNTKASSALPFGITLDGPETEVWFDPWARHMHSLGRIEFKMKHRLTGFTMDRGRIVGATVRDPRGRSVPVAADHFLTAIPGLNMQKVFSRQMVSADRNLAKAWNVVPAYETGFQFFFRDLDLTAGPVHPAKGWYTFLGGVNAIWNRNLRHYGDGRAGGGLDIEIFSTSLFHTPGILFGKPMMQLTREQTIAELKEFLSRYAGMRKAFRGDNFVGWTPHTTLEWKGRWVINATRAGDALGNWSNKPRPQQHGAIPNLFLAGGSTQSSTFIDNQDGAMETARRAVNALVERAGVHESPCWLPDYSPPKITAAIRADDDRRYAAGQPGIFDVVAPAPRR
ncbi:FAD-dependent oxidoreductase [Gordonia shandongensis]|uniref:FAD-dependent oxidoreductase n=1 Tax=Gordonia shandongensis TaxID=376351 RepID=UPI000A0724A7|nr:FAD-dependent oxidoreductase [Gordonia shandongensis]